MHLKRLEIQGFKSFAKKTTLEFETGITAIVGPNGSGKSNVADCLRWVLGEQSAKLIRGKKSEDVIFAGSDRKMRQGFAEAIATFDNRDHKIPLDASEVSIGRRIDRSGESEYLINGVRVRLLDVVDLVLKSNIGTSRYTVIGQGTIDNMILSGPAEIKNLLDEASGVKTYYIKREKTLRRLEQTAQNLMRAEDLISELEPRLKSLRRQAKRMEARAEIELELKQFQRDFLGKQYLDLKAQLQKIDAQLETIKTRRQDFEGKLESHRKNVESHEGRNRQELQGYKKIQDELRKLQERKNQLLESLSLVRGKMQGQKTGAGDAATLKVTVHEYEQKIFTAKEDMAQRSSELNGLEAKLSEATSGLSATDKQLDELYKALAAPLEINWDQVQGKLAAVEQAFENLFRRLSSAGQVSDLLNDADHFKRQFGEFKTVAAAAMKDPRATHARIQQQLQALIPQKDRLAAEIQTIEVNAAKARMAKDFLDQQINSLEKDKLHFDLELKKAQSTNSNDFLDSLVGEEVRIKKEIDALGSEMSKLEQAIEEFYKLEQEGRTKVADQEKQFRQVQDDLDKVKDQESGLMIERARFSTQAEAIVTEIHQTLGADAVSDIEARGVSADTDGLAEKIAKLKHQLDMIGGVDELTLQEYHETEARYTNLTTQVDDLKKGMNDLRQIIEELDGHIKVKFNEAFHRINTKFEEYFRILFNGGRAYLSMIRADDKTETAETEEGAEAEQPDQLRPEEKIVAKYEKGSTNIVGVDMKATPPNKKLSAIQALSGGERALTSIALLCALLSCFPSPFVVLDEVDAALDEANTIRFGQILGTLAHQTQFITITHNRETMAQSNTLYGVTMGDDGMSKLLSIKLEQAKVYAKS
jgi:chromosome segregation protein